MRHLIGYLRKPTIDSRVITSLSLTGSVPVIWLGGEHAGTAWAMRIAADDHAITVETDVELADDQVLSIEMGTTAPPRHVQGDLIEVEGQLIGLVIIPRADWAWR